MANNFIDDKEKMVDFKALSKDEFLKSYSYLTESEYNETQRKYMSESLSYIEKQNDFMQKLIEMEYE